ncbi:transposase, IS256 family [Thomasclavelia spiroformis DSM 1552]|uniref:Transposase, IS256 family n=1 Tax=Thomasclavelia spiroformis DSM 1552 TaxID=428126 RepID=B1C3F0_9FIRM|nr:transposase, IS256 family [Thomasclavelia spiroformis DSM 1552]
MEMPRIKRNPKKVALAQAILETYNPKSVEDMNNALKDLFGPLFESMLQGEMNNHLGYSSNDKGWYYVKKKYQLNRNFSI